MTPEIKSYIIYTIGGILTMIITALVAWFYKKHNIDRPKKIKTDQKTIDALIAEFNLIQIKKSKFPTSKRKKVVLMVDHMVKTKQIKVKDLNITAP